MIKPSKVAIAFALAAPFAIATAGNSKAAPVLSSSAAALKAASSSAVTDVQYYYAPYGYYPAADMLDRVGWMNPNSQSSDTRALRVLPSPLPPRASLPAPPDS